MSGDPSSSVDELYSLHSSWQQQLDSSHQALFLAHGRCRDVSSTAQSLSSFTAGLFALERRSLLEQIQSLCRDKLALKKQISDWRRSRDHTHTHTHLTPDLAYHLPSLSHSADNNGATASSSSPSLLAVPSSSSPSDLLLRAEVDELRSQVHRLRSERQLLVGHLKSVEAELEEAELSIARLSRERDRLAERLREAEDRAVAGLEAQSAMQEVVRRALDKERMWMEERAEIEREMERMGTEGSVLPQVRREVRVGASVYGAEAVQRLLQGTTRHPSEDSEDSDDDRFESTTRADSLDQ